MTGSYRPCFTKLLLEYVELPQRANILDLGCGTGRLLERLANEFPHLRGTGLDLSSKMLQVARLSNRHHPQLIFIEGKAEALPFGNSQFDAVFNSISFLHYQEPKQVLQEVARVLTPGGRFYLARAEFILRLTLYSGERGMNSGQ